jgi:hypothetical protein
VAAEAKLEAHLAEHEAAEAERKVGLYIFTRWDPI